MKVVAAGVGIGLFAWTIAKVGPSALARQLPSLRDVLILAVVLAAFRFVLQAIGWRLAMPQSDRPSTGRTLLAVIAGEAAGYLTWGPLSREPVKAMMLNHRLPTRVSLRAAVAERLAYTSAAATLVIIGLVILAIRTGHTTLMALGLLTLALLGTLVSRRWLTPMGAIARTGGLRLMGLGMLQEVTNVFETYVVFSWLGASPTLEAAIVFEGLARLANSAGAFVPGKVGVTEIAGAGIAQAMRLGSVHGLTLALTRRLRSLLWTGVGVLVLVLWALSRSNQRSPTADPAAA